MKMRSFVIRWFITSIAIGVATTLTGIKHEGFFSLVAAALLLGILNAVVRPILLLLGLPFIVVTLGFFILIVNTLLLKFVLALVPGFETPTFWSAFFASLIISFVSWLLSAFFHASDGSVHTINFHGAPKVDDGPKQADARVIEPGE